MRSFSVHSVSRFAVALSVLWTVGCGSESDGSPGSGGLTGVPGGGSSGTVGVPGGGAAGASGGGPTFGGGPAGGSGPIGGGSAGLPGVAGSGGVPGGGAGGMSAGGAPSGGAGSNPPPPPLDCGPIGVAIENAGPPRNRVNYVILGDGYTQAQLDTTYIEHLNVAMAKRFSAVIGQPYGRYRKFVNICALKTVSMGGIGSGQTPFDCTGDDQSRLARCDQNAANAAIMANLPASFEVDWKALVLNNNRWWNTGAVLMLWSGAHQDAAGAALHEGGHGFHQLADEYSGTNSGCNSEEREVNMTADSSMTAGKWTLWLNYTQTGATGLQTTIQGGRYCNAGQYRPSQNSMMNSLFGNNPNTSFNSVSREKMVMDIYRAVTPVDATTPPAGAVSGAQTLTVQVIDPAVINVDWSVDGTVVAANGGQTFDVAARNLSPGMHTVTARAYDNAGNDLVRYTMGGTQYGRMNWARAQQTVTWNVTIP